MVGAGPYGLSVAAHLAALGCDFRIFGEPLDTWRRHMPQAMVLKSDGFASSLSAPRAGATLADYCADHGIAYEPMTAPTLATFIDYALDFQRRHVPTLEPRTVTALAPVDGGGYRLTLDDGQTCLARRVVLAVGITHFDQTPEILRHLGADLVSHSSAHDRFDGFAGRDVTVLGAGSSAIEGAVPR